ncbi:MAG: thiamine-phosphate pyrophosphorylase [Blastocatellia bacterium]|nr:thiamine-phosphate pyrophosphorylase [Blastocatellia bacterium]
MRLELKPPITCLITSGNTDANTTPQSREFGRIVSLVEAAALAGITIVQLREKRLSTRTLFELTKSCVQAIGQQSTRLLVNDRADVAFGALADGVHLTTKSMPAKDIRSAFGDRFIIGVSTHSLDEVRQAKDGLADFATFGPVFHTSTKLVYGQPVGLEALRDAASLDADFPLLALGGVNIERAAECFKFGAKGIAGISMFSDPIQLADTVNSIRTACRGAEVC